MSKLTTFAIPKKGRSFVNQNEDLNSAIEEADRISGHVIESEKGYEVLSDYQLLMRKRDALYSAGTGVDNSTGGFNLRVA